MTEILRLRLSRASRHWFSDAAFASSANAYVRSLSEQGYALQTVQAYLEGVAHYAHWCGRRGICLCDTSEDVVKRFVDRHLPFCCCAERCQRTRHSVAAALRHFLHLLRSEGRIAPRRSEDPSRITEEIHHFEQYLKEVRGLRVTTCVARLRNVRAFLLDQFGARPIIIEALTPKVVSRFFRKHTRGLSSSSKRDVGTSLRSYFQFKAVLGEGTARLAAAVPTVAQWRLTQLPTGPSADEITRLLNAFDRSSSSGRRDYAIARCFVDLGLRTGEVARLSLEDIDWREGLVHIRGKGSRIDLLPLPQITGRAIVDYLRHGRPRTCSRALFLRHHPPLGAAATAGVIRAAVRSAAARSGVEPCLNGPRVLRHALAERLVQKGTPLKEIADLLRHRSLDTTTIYAKVDLPALSQVALPWPGRRS